MRAWRSQTYSGLSVIISTFMSRNELFTDPCYIDICRNLAHMSIVHVRPPSSLSFHHGKRGGNFDLTHQTDVKLVGASAWVIN